MNQMHILFIPPNGQFKKQDFSLQRISKWLSHTENIKTTLLHVKPEFFNPQTTMFDTIIEVSTEEEIFTKLKEISFDKIFHRSWMGGYEFAAKLVKDFDNVIINLKDWNFAPQDIYAFFYPENKDHESIEYIFKNCNTILSHFTKEQAEIWAQEYNVSSDKFIFFPEYCNPNSFHIKPILPYENLHLVYAGALPASSFAEDYFPGKSHLRAIKRLTKQRITVDFVLPEDVYETTMKSTELFKDFLYENAMNKRFHLIKGKALQPTILDKYHFGFFELEASGINYSLYQYAITSKFAFYLEAGLPILINDRFHSIAKIVKENDLGIVFNNADIENFHNILAISQEQYNTFIDNIKRYRTSFIYNDEKRKKLGLTR